MSEEQSGRGKGCLKVFAVLSISFAVIIAGFIAYAVLTSEESDQKQDAVIQQSEIDKRINELLVSNQIKPATIIKSKDISHATRSRYNTSIFVPEALTNDQLLATAADIAMQVQRDNRVQFSSVAVFDSAADGTPYLTVDFAADRMGIMGEKDIGSRFEVTWYNKLTQ